MSTDIDTIVTAIEYEADLGAKYLDCVIHRRERHGRIWSVLVEPARHDAQLDESLEGSAAWWPGPPVGIADVLSIVPEDHQLNLRLATTDVPSSGRLRIYPIRFLDRLATLWSSPFRGPRFLNARERLQSNTAAPAFSPPNPRWFPELRPAQRDAFRLLAHPASFLWGPPGTGKTHTIGTLLASFLIENRNARILLISTTNSAVDLALISVDKALERIAGIVTNAAQCRRACKRIGTHFGAHHYRDRQHLLPGAADCAIQQLADLETTCPDSADAPAYDLWKSSVEDLRDRMRIQTRVVLRKSRLAAMTSTRGIFSYDDLEETGPFDLIVFDEASQVGLAHTLPFLPLAQRVLFAGDPKQLEPIVVADDREVREWLGRSAFAFMQSDHPNMAMLTEQSRMGPDICHVVSETFYSGRLKVCAKAAADPIWRAERLLSASAAALCSLDIATNGKFHPGFRGFTREESADRIVSAVSRALRHNDPRDNDPRDIVVLTPYRAQRSILRRKLRAAGIVGVQVSTVHRAQGSERKVVFFDPVLGAHHALTDRLLNVAISRAQASLTIACSPGDLANPRLAQIHALINPNLQSQRRSAARQQNPLNRSGVIRGTALRHL